MMSLPAEDFECLIYNAGKREAAVRNESIDFSADLEVLQEVAVIKKEMEAKGEQLKDQTLCSFETDMDKYPTLERAEVIITVANARKQLKLITFAKFNKEEPVPDKRWPWLAEDQESLRMMPQSVKVLQDKLFTELKDDKLDRSRTMSVSNSQESS